VWTKEEIHVAKRWTKERDICTSPIVSRGTVQVGDAVDGGDVQYFRAGKMVCVIINYTYPRIGRMASVIISYTYPGVVNWRA